jgi:hypothetical protein
VIRGLFGAIGRARLSALTRTIVDREHTVGVDGLVQVDAMPEMAAM